MDYLEDLVSLMRLYMKDPKFPNYPRGEMLQLLLIGAILDVETELRHIGKVIRDLSEGKEV